MTTNLLCCIHLEAYLFNSNNHKTLKLQENHFLWFEGFGLEKTLWLLSSTKLIFVCDVVLLTTAILNITGLQMKYFLTFN